MIFERVFQWKELMFMLASHKIILFGNQYQKVCDTLKKVDENFLNNVDFIVDSNIGNHQEIKDVLGHKYPVISTEEMRSRLANCHLVIICSNNLEGILAQLGYYPELEETLVLFQEDIITNEKYRDLKLPKSLRISDKPLIPKVIHYCWFGGNPIPEKYKYWMKTWKKYCPDYEIVEWNESNYDYKKNQFMYEAYKAKKWGFVPDYARLDIIYNYGGIYLDTDVELVKNLDELLYEKAFAGIQANLVVALGLGFGGKPHIPIFKILKDFYEDKEFINNDGTFNTIASPYLTDNVLKELGFNKVNKYQVVGDLTIYPAPVLGGFVHPNFDLVMNDNVYLLHHYDGSWLTEKEQHNRKKLVGRMDMSRACWERRKARQQ